MVQMYFTNHSNDLFSGAATMDKGTVLKLIGEAHQRNWLLIRDDLIEQYKYTFTDKELHSILKMIGVEKVG